jgi:hypothetical protein
MEKIRITESAESLPKIDYPSYPMTVRAGVREFRYFDGKDGSDDDSDLISLIRKEKSAEIDFYSSQSPLVFRKIHSLTDIFLSDSASKIDAVLRELVKNAEKENVAFLAHRIGLIPSREHHPALDFVGKVLQEKMRNADTGLPILYQFPETLVRVKITIRDSEMHFEITNSGDITPENREIIRRRIDLGLDVAHLDTRQEYEMKVYDGIRDIIRELFSREYGEDRFEEFWKAAFEEEFDDWWRMSPYFMLLAAGTHSSFYPYFADAFMQLRQAYKRIEKPDEPRYSAGMGYIQCAFMVEANRTLLGTYGKVNVPESLNDKTVAGFFIGLPKMEPIF